MRRRRLAEETFTLAWIVPHLKVATFKFIFVFIELGQSDEIVLLDHW
jgi:hypothetical protein